MDQHIEETIPLAPSGISPWNHRASVDERGCLVLAWTMANGGERVRTFTAEETRILYELLRERLD